MKGTHTAIVYVQRPLKFQPLDKFSSSCENDDTCDETLTTKKKTSLLLQRYTSCVWIHWIVHSLSKNSFIEAKGRRTQDATRDEKGTKWKIVNFMECFIFFMAFGLHPADNVQLMTEVQSAQPCQPSSSTGDNKTLQLWKHSYLHVTFQFTLYMLLQIIMTCLKTVVLRKRACMQTGFASY